MLSTLKRNIITATFIFGLQTTGHNLAFATDLSDVTIVTKNCPSGFDTLTNVEAEVFQEELFSKNHDQPINLADGFVLTRVNGSIEIVPGVPPVEAVACVKNDDPEDWPENEEKNVYYEKNVRGNNITLTSFDNIILLSENKNGEVLNLFQNNQTINAFINNKYDDKGKVTFYLPALPDFWRGRRINVHNQSNSVWHEIDTPISDYSIPPNTTVTLQYQDGQWKKINDLSVPDLELTDYYRGLENDVILEFKKTTSWTNHNYVTYKLLDDGGIFTAEPISTDGQNGEITVPKGAFNIHLYVQVGKQDNDYTTNSYLDSYLKKPGLTRMCFHMDGLKTNGNKKARTHWKEDNCSGKLVKTTYRGMDGDLYNAQPSKPYPDSLPEKTYHDIARKVNNMAAWNPTRLHMMKYKKNFWIPNAVGLDVQIDTSKFDFKKDEVLRILNDKNEEIRSFKSSHNTLNFKVEDTDKISIEFNSSEGRKILEKNRPHFKVKVRALEYDYSHVPPVINEVLEGKIDPDNPDSDVYTYPQDRRRKFDIYSPVLLRDDYISYFSTPKVSAYGYSNQSKYYNAYGYLGKVIDGVPGTSELGEMGLPVGELKIKLSNGRSAICTATLVGEGYIITASHCFEGANIDSNEKFKLKLNYTLDVNNKKYTPVTLDAKLVYMSESGPHSSTTAQDFAILEVVSEPRFLFNAAKEKVDLKIFGYYLLPGRNHPIYSNVKNNKDYTISSDAFMIHHPGGDFKTASLGTNYYVTYSSEDKHTIQSFNKVVPCRAYYAYEYKHITSECYGMKGSSGALLILRESKYKGIPVGVASQAYDPNHGLYGPDESFNYVVYSPLRQLELDMIDNRNFIKGITPNKLQQVRQAIFSNEPGLYAYRNDTHNKNQLFGRKAINFKFDIARSDQLHGIKAWIPHYFTKSYLTWSDGLGIVSSLDELLRKQDSKRIVNIETSGAIYVSMETHVNLKNRSIYNGYITDAMLKSVKGSKICFEMSGTHNHAYTELKSGASCGFNISDDKRRRVISTNSTKASPSVYRTKSSSPEDAYPLEAMEKMF